MEAIMYSEQLPDFDRPKDLVTVTEAAGRMQSWGRNRSFIGPTSWPEGGEIPRALSWSARNVLNLLTNYHEACVVNIMLLQPISPFYFPISYDMATVRTYEVGLSQALLSVESWNFV